MVSGIYQIKNQINGNRYIGSAINIRYRWAVHLSTLRHGKHDNHHLQHAFDKYGETVFAFTILERVGDVSQLILREQYALNTLRPEYNIATVAGNTFGYRHTDEARRKMSEAQSGDQHPLYGKHHSEETRGRMSEAQIGERSHCYGKRLGVETRKKLSEVMCGRNHSAVTRAKMSAAHKGKHHSEETKRKLSEINRGRHHSAETRAKISASRRRYFYMEKP